MREEETKKEEEIILGSFMGSSGGMDRYTEVYGEIVRQNIDALNHTPGFEREVLNALGRPFKKVSLGGMDAIPSLDGLVLLSHITISHRQSNTLKESEVRAGIEEELALYAPRGSDFFHLGDPYPAEEEHFDESRTNQMIPIYWHIPVAYFKRINTT